MPTAVMGVVRILKGVACGKIGSSTLLSKFRRGASTVLSCTHTHICSTKSIVPFNKSAILPLQGVKILCFATYSSSQAGNKVV